MLEALGVEGKQVAFFEDSHKNLVAAKTLGMTTVLINTDTAKEEGVTAEMLADVDAVVLDHELSIEALKAVLPQLWDKQ